MNENNTANQTVQSGFNKLTNAIKDNWFTLLILVNFVLNMGLGVLYMLGKDYAQANTHLLFANLSSLFFINKVTNKN
jgi:hypothetical protein